MNYKWNAKNIFVTFSYKCNCFCKKCITRYHKNFDNEMNDDIFDKLCLFLSRQNFRGWISLGSGEPLLYKNIEKRVLKLLSINEYIKVRILTNGKLFGNIPNNLKNNTRILWGVTFDSFENSSIVDLQKNMDVEKVKKSVCEFLRTNNNLYLNYTLTKNSQPTLEQFLRFALQNNAKETYITELKIWDQLKDELNKYKPSLETVMPLLQRYESIFMEKNLRLYLPKLSDFRGKENCLYKGHNNLIIDVDGSVAFCSGREESIIGNIRDLDILTKIEKFGNSLIKNNINWCDKCVNKMNSDGTFHISEKIYDRNFRRI